MNTEYRKKNISKLVIFSAIAVLVLCAVLYSVFSIHHSSSISVPLSYEQQVEQAKQGNASALSPEAAQAAQQAAAAQFVHTYESDLGFSFGYPDSLKVGADDDTAAGATTITAQNTDTHVGFQITVTPSEETDITTDKINADLPQIGAHSFQPVSLDGTQGIAFAATDAFFGDSIQIWLIHDGSLYQISTYATQGPLVSKVLGTWKWMK